MVLALLLALPPVQSLLGRVATQKLNETYGTNIQVEGLSFSLFGSVNLHHVYIEDHHNDTLIYAQRLQTHVQSFERLLDGDLLFDRINAEQLEFNLVTYPGENFSNLDDFIEKFETGEPSSGIPFLMQVDQLRVNNGRFRLIDHSLETPQVLDFTQLVGDISEFQIYGPDVTMHIHSMSMRDFRGLQVENLHTNFSYSLHAIHLEDLQLHTSDSYLRGQVALIYDRSDFVDFNNKVKFDVHLDSAMVASNEIAYFYSEIGREKMFDLKTDLNGTLNDFRTPNLRLVDEQGAIINGDIRFKNLFSRREEDHFEIRGNFRNVSSSYGNLSGLLPNILGSKLPTAMEKLGNFTLKGWASVTPFVVEAEVDMFTALGGIQTDLIIESIDDIDRAAYKGTIATAQFNLGQFIEMSDLGTVTGNMQVNGKGFTRALLDTHFEGNIDQIQFRDYNYTQIDLNGNFKQPYFTGKLKVNDPNLFMDFDGEVNLSQKELGYRFNAIVDYANLSEMRWVSHDSIAVFKGQVISDIQGNSLDDLKGKLQLQNASFQNSQSTYFFEDCLVSSEFDQDQVRTIRITSPDIINGVVRGKFKIAELEDLVENSIGSIYSNYSPNRVSSGQFVRFNVEVFNQIVEIFVPDLRLSPNTRLRGSISADDNEFRLRVLSPEIVYGSNSAHNLNLQIDNKNPLYNAFVELDSIQTPIYTLREINAINVTARDSMFVRTEFKGGKENNDRYLLNLFHTIDAQKNFVAGFQKSDISFKNRVWHINEFNSPHNKILFNQKRDHFALDRLTLSHGNEMVQLVGVIQGKENKDVVLQFDNVDLFQVTPELTGFDFKGLLNGQLSFKQSKDIFHPAASLTIKDFEANNTPMGDLDLNVFGDEALEKFQIISNLEEQGKRRFRAEGVFERRNTTNYLNLDYRFNDFNIGFLNGLLAGDAVSDIEGKVSGICNMEGALDDLEVNGRLYATNTAMRIPYTNVRYEMDPRSVLDVTEKSFIFRSTGITDTKYQTKGRLEGRITHDAFSKWDLDITVNSDRLLALDTSYEEEALYYGLGFIKGNARIDGPVENLYIGVAAESQSGTSIKIPINTLESTANKNYIEFLSPDQKLNNKKAIAFNQRKYHGLELEFDFDITPEAEIEVILDHNSGHGMKGRGFGSLLFKINTLGSFNMWGDFQAYEGTYNFKYGGLIDKKFQLKKGGSITWEGDPLRAVLNLEAVYTTTANPAILLENPSVNKKVPVEVVVGVRGNIMAPEPDFSINFPTVSSVLKSEIQYKLDDKDKRQTQALYLLSSGTFLSAEGVSQTDFTANLFEKASGLFSDIFVDPDSQVQVGMDYVAADRRPGSEADGRVGVTVTAQVNDRISINGKLGVPVGGINQSAVVGDVEFLYRVNEDGTMNLRIFNRENDINYISDATIRYTQGVGISYEVDFNTFRELINRVFKNIQLEEVPSNPNRIEHEDNYVPDGIEFQSRHERKKRQRRTEQPVNRDAVPSED